MPRRKNSRGIDLHDRRILDEVAAAVSIPFAGESRGRAGGLDSGRRRHAPDEAVSRAAAAFADWSKRGVEERAACLDRLSDLLEEDRAELMRLAVQEGGKTIPDALGEVREAVDFCRYYAAEARARLTPVELPGPTGERNVLRMEGRGAWLCISPWNFPLAIFLGQVTAALVAGNSVVAKPAPQTPMIAARAVALAHRAGVPRDALVLAPGGPETGAALTADPRIAGVAFTGSTATARSIARSLLEADERPLVPLIAETGGVNAMIVDSTALPEQLVVDVMASAFRSAGQRCSALRLLVLQEDVAEPILAMLKGAMDTLVLGDPASPETDVGPVIDQAAHERLMEYREAMKDRWIHTVPTPEGEGRFFVPPTMIAIDAIEDLRTEWFGPLLHVASWEAGKLAETVERVNANGYGLTMGLHSRIARAAETVEDKARVGNLYVNRSMIGAVVGSQPFGGERLSGTGPKAGGPHYLPRFCAERVTSTDTTSAGGNATLLSLDDVGI
ncbi:MAG: L-glutamate gamma-semialdehyde dehydrogenase [Sphingomonadaceae bacterium]